MNITIKDLNASRFVMMITQIEKMTLLIAMFADANKATKRLTQYQITVKKSLVFLNVLLAH